MTKTTKKSEDEASILDKKSIIIHKGTSSSGRKIKPKSFFGETIIKVADTASSKPKVKGAGKVNSKPKVEVSKDESKAKVESNKTTPKTKQPTKKKTEKVKTPQKKVLKKENAKVENKAPSSSPIHKEITLVDVESIISKSVAVTSPKKSPIINPSSSTPNPKIIPKKISTIASPVSKTFVEREREIIALRKRLAELEKLQEEEKKIMKKVPVKIVKLAPVPTPKATPTEKSPVLKKPEQARPPVNKRTIKPTLKVLEGNS